MRVICCRSLRESVDWNLIRLTGMPRLRCRSLRESVDWNHLLLRADDDGFMSLSSWERGLKSCFGLWQTNFKAGSLSSWERGLKCKRIDKIKQDERVALFVRAWIEMSLTGLYPSLNGVALFVRAWIEIWSIHHQFNPITRSLSSWERGLKLLTSLCLEFQSPVALFVRAWIEIIPVNSDLITSSVALFVRAWIEIRLSCWTKKLPYLVALFVRAWIEINAYIDMPVTVPCRSLRESVDWNSGWCLNGLLWILSLSSWERGLKFAVYPRLLLFFYRVALFVRAWIEMAARFCEWQWPLVALFVRAWIEIASFALSKISAVWSLSSWERGLKYGV